MAKLLEPDREQRLTRYVVMRLTLCDDYDATLFLRIIPNFLLPLKFNYFRTNGLDIEDTVISLTVLEAYGHLY